MKKLIIPIVCLLLFSCQANKNKAGFKQMCLGEINVSIKNGAFTENQADKLCDCWAEKVANKYATTKEADADRMGTRQIAEDCKKEISK